MMLHFLVVLVGLVSSLVIPDPLSLVKQESQLCNSPDGLPYLYNGFRAYQVLLLDWPVRHYWYLARCSLGTIVEQQFFVVNKTTNFMFGEPLCISKGECYIIARRHKYAPRLSPIYRPFATVGALFKYDPDTNATIPLTLMKSDNAGATVTLMSGFHTTMRFTPVLFSPGALLGISRASTQDILPFENYTYTAADTNKPWWKINEFVNKLVSASQLSDSFSFWEFDALQRHLCDEMGWRDKLNTVISVPDTSKHNVDQGI